MSTLFIILIYISFILDFVVFPIPSEASTQSIINKSRYQFSAQNILIGLSHLLLLLLWLYPLFIALMRLTQTNPTRLIAHDAMNSLNLFLMLQSAGIALALFGRFTTLLASNTIRRTEPNTLIRHGIFSHSRHPIVLGLHLTLLGLLISTGTPFVLLLFPLTLIYFDKKISIEESHLLSQYGDNYRNYRTHTHRYWQF